MKKPLFHSLRDTLIAGVFFLAPLILLSLLFKKVWDIMHGISTKLADVLGLESSVRPVAALVIATVSIILLCLVSGWLVRVGLLGRMSRWFDEKLISYLPGYAIYRQMAENQVEDQGATPYQEAALLKQDDGEVPVFVVEHLKDGRSVLFLPTVGNPKEGTLLVTQTTRLVRLGTAGLKPIKRSLGNKGLGLGAAIGAVVLDD